MKEVVTVFKYQLISPENLRPRESSDVCKETQKLISELQEMKHAGAKKYNSPQLIILLPEAQDIEDVYKELLKLYKKFSGKSPHDQKYDVRVTKFHNKHIKDIKEYENILG